MIARTRLYIDRGAHDRIRTGDLFLTKEVLCHLSYVGPAHRIDHNTHHNGQGVQNILVPERETA